MLDYLLDSERKSYEEYCSRLIDEMRENYHSIWHKYFYNKPEINHIYAIVLRVKDSIYF